MSDNFEEISMKVFHESGFQLFSIHVPRRRQRLVLEPGR
jgi:hypothetical protein